MGKFAHTVACGKKCARAFCLCFSTFLRRAFLICASNQIRLNGNPTEQRRNFCRVWLWVSMWARWRCPKPSAGSDVVSMKLRAEKRNRPLPPCRATNIGSPMARCDRLAFYAKNRPPMPDKRDHRLLDARKDMKGFFNWSKHFDKLGMPPGRRTAELNLLMMSRSPFEKTFWAMKDARGCADVLAGTNEKSWCLAGIGLGIMARLSGRRFMRRYMAERKAVRAAHRELPADAG